MSDIETIRVLTGNNEVSDDVIAFYLKSVRNLILGYCNISKIPVGLETTLLEITALKVKANFKDSKAVLGEGIKSVAGISDGNQSIAYQGGVFRNFASDEDILLAYASVLDRYRKMVVNKPAERHLGARNIILEQD